MRIPFAIQISCLVLIPVGLLLWVGGSRLGGLRQEATISVGQARRSELMLANARMIDAMQAERGASIAAAAGAIVADLAVLRQRTDEAIEGYGQPYAIAGFPPAPAPEALRQAMVAARAAPPKPAALRAAYNSEIDRLISVQFSIGNAQTTRGIGKVLAAVATIEYAKEHAGRLRAGLTLLATTDQPVDEPDYRALLSSLSQVWSLLAAYDLPIDKTAMQRLRALDASPARAELARVFDLIGNKRATGGYGLEAKAVFSSVSTLTKGLGTVIDEEAQRAAGRSKGMVEEAHTALRHETAIFAGGLILTAVVAIWLVLGLNRGLRIAARRLAEVAQGRLSSSSLPPKSISRLASRRDELGDLGRDLAGAEEYLARIAVAAQALAGGDLSARIEARGSDDELGNAFVRMTSSLNQTIGEVASVTQSLSAATTELAATTKQLNGGAEVTRSASGSAAAAATEGVTQVQSLVASADELSSSVREVASNGQQMAGRITEVAALAEAMTKASGAIGGIAETISGIAGQTNLLALNATIEAARAGEAGRGFAVVAGEVKGLAQQAASAAADIQRTVVELTGRISSLDEGMRSSQGAAQGIAAAVEEQSATTTEMARGLAETGQGLAEILRGVQRVSDQASELAQGVAQADQAVQELDRLAQKLRTSVGHFRTADFLVAAKDLHKAWRQRLIDAIASGARIDGDRACDPHRCDLGCWIDGPGGRAHGDRTTFSHLVEEHRSFHASIREVLDHATRGDAVAAKAAVESGEFHRRSTSVIRHLDALAADLGKPVS
ncbi:MAG TPA: hypothetical protein DCS97_07210 [Planctomycetes bacterium]|nr:hypothetical protein [Planctomycetota bacterium]